MEKIGGSLENEKSTHGTIHYWNDPSMEWTYCGGKKVNSTKLSGDFHVYGIDRTETKIDWYFDRMKFHTESIIGSAKSEFIDKEYIILLNLAVGGNWSGYPDETTVFPKRLYVDWIKVF